MLYSIFDKQKFYHDLDFLSGNIHDGSCTLFMYNGNHQELKLTINNQYADSEYYRIPIYVSFKNIKMLLSTHFDIWGTRSPENEEIFGIEPFDAKNICDSLNFLQSISCAGGLSQTEISKLLGIRLLFCSGNEIILLCENASITPNSIVESI